LSSPFGFFSSFLLSSSLDIRHFTLPPLLPLSSLELSFSLLEGNPPFPLGLSGLGVGSGRCEIGVGIGSSLGWGPVVREKIV